MFDRRDSPVSPVLVDSERGKNSEYIAFWQYFLVLVSIFTIVVILILNIEKIVTHQIQDTASWQRSSCLRRGLNGNHHGIPWQCLDDFESLTTSPLRRFQHVSTEYWILGSKFLNLFNEC